MFTFELTIKGETGKGIVMEVMADTQEKALEAFKLRHPEAEVMKCELVEEVTA